MNKIALGTAQFGLNYGISNQIGKTEFTEVEKILLLAKKSKVNFIDTAVSYGQCEEVLGNANIEHFNLISKLPPIPQNCKDIHNWLYTTVKVSLKKLKIKKLYGLLLHNPDDLFGVYGPHLIKSLEDIKLNGLIKKIGISVYELEEIKKALNIMKLEIVQAPLNIIDRRLEKSGWLKKLHNKNIEIHTRSTFLQGLLLMQQNKIPIKFKKWSDLFDRWFFELKKHNLNPVQACLSYPMSLPEVDHIVVGVNNADQLKKLIKFSRSKTLNHDLSFMTSNDNLLINPSNWKNI